MSWDKVKIGDRCEITSSKRIFFSEYVECGVPFYRSKEIIESSNGQVISEPLFISQEKYDEIKRNFGVPQPGDMLLTSVGTIGVPYIVKEDDYFYFKDGNLTWFRKFNNELTSQYLYYWVRSAEGQGVLNNTTIGSSQRALTIASLKGLEIPCPPVNVQHRIVEILSSYDALIENNQKQIKLLEEAAQRLYKEWFVDLRFPGHETTLIIDGVPAGWSIGEVAGFGEIVTGKTPSTSKEEYYGGNIPFVKIPDMHNRVFPVTTEVCLSKEGADTQKNKYIPRNSLMVSCIATVGLVNIALEECQTNQQINSVILHNERDLYFLYFTLKQMKDLLDGVGSNGATMTNVNKTKFGKIPVVCPSADMRNAFYEWCDPLFRKIENLSRNIVLLQEARDSLLPKLMNGETEV